MGPIAFKALKHHLPTIAHRIVWYSRQGPTALPQLIQELFYTKGIIDVYEGQLSVAEIEAEVDAFLKKKGLLSLQDYQQYMEEQGQIKRQGYYSSLVLSDGTEMTLRVAPESEQYVHIHPARYARNTFRVRTNTIKTALITYFLSLCHQAPPSLDFVNQAREALELSPLPEIPAAIAQMLDKLAAVTQKCADLPPHT